MFLEIRELSKSYRGKPVLRDIGISVSRGELVSIVGPSGAGKTTLLKIVCGIEKPDSGFIIFEDNHTRGKQPILVYQDYILFPGMTVFENIAFGLRATKSDKKIIIKKVSEIMEFFSIAHLAGSYPSQISAGEKQRTAVARALVINPPMLLLDEPFANLDRNLKLETAEFIRMTQKKFGITTVSVTHDLKEAFMISDRIAVMINGEIIQYDRPENIYQSPSTFDVASLLGDINIIPADTARMLTQEEIPADIGRVCVRPESVLFTIDSGGEGIVENVSFAGHYYSVTADFIGTEIRSFSSGGGFAPGDRIGITVKEIIKFRR